MEREETKLQDTEAPKDIVQSDHYDIGQRLIFVTTWLEKSGLGQEAIMLGYFNECMRVAMGGSDIVKPYLMADRLQSHAAQLAEKLLAAFQATRLEGLPTDPIKK